ncbi:MAG: hypothetical protein NWR30_10080 [Salibacteraceae bacterium]|nr:hypothetical protein [Salibacteraceae bacterium]
MMFRLPTLKNDKEPVCVKCGSLDVRRTNPSVVVLLYFISLQKLKHVHFKCFDCGNEWYDYYFKSGWFS